MESSETSQSTSSSSAWKYVLWAAAGGLALSGLAAVWVVKEGRRKRHAGMKPAYTDMTPLDDSETAFELFLATTLSLDTANELTLDEKRAACDAALANGSVAAVTAVLPQLVFLYTVAQGMEAVTALRVIATALDQAGRTSESCTVGRKMLSLLSKMPQKQELDVRVDAIRSYAQACCDAERYELALATIEECVTGLKPSTFLAGALLHKAEILNQYAIRLDRHQENPRFWELLSEAYSCCDRARQVMDMFQDAFQNDFVFSRPESLRVFVSSTLGDMDQLEADYERYIWRILESRLNVNPQRHARIYEEYGVTCMDGGSEASTAKAEIAFEKAIDLYREIPGLEGIKLETYSRAEHLARLYLRQEKVEENKEAIEACLRYIEAHGTKMFSVENDELRVESCAGVRHGLGVVASLAVRVKRRISTKEPRLPNGSVMIVELFDEASGKPFGKEKRIVLTAKVLDNEIRSKRVVKFGMPVPLDALRTLIDIRVESSDGRILSRLVQPYLTKSLFEDSEAQDNWDDKL